jgi:DnaJ-domain-containing protein 1
MSVEAYNKMNEELLSELTLKYTKLLKMFENDNVKVSALRSLKDKLLDLKKLNEGNATSLSKFNLSKYTPLLQNLIDASSLTQSATSNPLSKASVFTEEV